MLTELNLLFWGLSCVSTIQKCPCMTYKHLWYNSTLRDTTRVLHWNWNFGHWNFPVKYNAKMWGPFLML